MDERVSPFRAHVDQSAIDDLQRRLRITRWPDAGAGDWSDGTSLPYLREVCAYWCDRFDWRAAEQRLNAFPQVRIACKGLTVHALHVRGNGPAPLPLVLTHGWPGSVFEMLGIIPQLTDPAAFGGDPADAFDLVVPSLPGYGFSDRPSRGGFNLTAISTLWVEVMGALGYERFGAQGGDWGAQVSTQLAITAPDHLIGVHTNYMMRGYLPTANDIADPSDEERRFYDHAARFAAVEGAYVAQQATKPQSLAYGLNDSPAGLAGWILEKFHTWADDADALDRDDLLANVSLYWFTQTIGSSMRLYRERLLAPFHPPATPPPVPFGYADFPREIMRAPRSLIERVFHVERYTTMPRGGHFAALEEPALLAEDVRAFFRPLRGK